MRDGRSDLKVALNGTSFNDRPSGATQRFIGIYRDLARRMPQLQFVIFEPSDCHMKPWFSDISNIQVRATPIPSEGMISKFINSSFFWSTTLAREKFDLFEGFHLPLPKSPTGKTVLTVHDVRRLRADWSLLGRIGFRYGLGRALKNADLVVTVSRTIKQELQAYFGNIPIVVIPNGIDTINSKTPTDAELECFKFKFKIFSSFILAVGHLERRKNYPNLIKAIACLRAAGFYYHLVIIGNDSGERAVLESHINAYKLSGQITLLSGLSDFEVRCAYALCSLFVFPSTYEGFGIPILEAMAAGCPMALADIPVFREITEGRSIYFSPADTKDIAGTIQRVLTSPQEQSRMIEYGLKRSRAFRYADIGAQYERLYTRLLGLSQPYGAVGSPPIN